MKFKSRAFILRRKSFTKLAILGISIALSIKLFSFIDIGDGLYALANNLNISEGIVNHELTYIPQSRPTPSDFLSSQSALLSADTAPIEAAEPELLPWTLEVPKSNALPIKSISINPTSPGGYVNLGKIYLKNDSSKKIDLNWYLKSEMPFSLSGSGPHVLIVHTHGSESYSPEGRDSYTPDDVDRTVDTRYNVVRIGDEIESILKSKGISVIHDRNIYDSPTYSGSYTRALDAITKQMVTNPGIKVILDIHRDSIVSDNGTKYKTSATVNGKPSAQLMLVMSTGESGLPHPNWQENLKFGIKLQCQIANKYPGLMRPINLRTERFNMHVTTGSLLVEVGSSANTLEEALTAIRPFSEELAALLLSVKKT